MHEREVLNSIHSFEQTAIYTIIYPEAVPDRHAGNIKIWQIDIAVARSLALLVLVCSEHFGSSAGGTKTRCLDAYHITTAPIQDLHSATCRSRSIMDTIQIHEQPRLLSRKMKYCLALRSWLLEPNVECTSAGEACQLRLQCIELCTATARVHLAACKPLQPFGASLLCPEHA